MTQRAQQHPSSDERSAGGFIPLQAGASPQLGFWTGDRDASPAQPAPLAYTTEDFRRELARVERRRLWLALGVCVVLVAAVIIGFIVVSG